MDTRNLTSTLFELTNNTPVDLKSAETIKTFIDATVQECIKNKVFDEHVRQSLSVALEMYADNIIGGLQDTVYKSK